METDDKTTIHIHVSQTDHPKAKEVKGERKREREGGEIEGQVV